MGRNYTNKNLTELEMGNIEFYLNEGKGYSEIGRLLERSEATIRIEIKKYSSYFGEARKCSNCLNKDDCHQKYLCENIIDKVKCSSCKYCINAVKICPNYKVTIDCELLKKNHHVCNGCDLYFKCKKVKIKYFIIYYCLAFLFLRSSATFCSTSVATFSASASETKLA